MSQDFLSQEHIDALLGSDGIVATQDDWAEAMREMDSERAPRMCGKPDDKMTLDDWIRYYTQQVRAIDAEMVRAECRKSEINMFLNVLNSMKGGLV